MGILTVPKTRMFILILHFLLTSVLPLYPLPSMDSRTRDVLRRISRGIPAHLARNVVRREVDHSQEDRAREVLASRDVPYKEKERVRRLLDQGAFRREETVENEAVIKEIDRYNEAKVAQARAHGDLADPMSDPFYRDRMKRIAENKAKKTDPLSQAEIEKATQQLKQ